MRRTSIGEDANVKKDSKIIIVRGNSGSGKTSVAKALQNKFGHGALLISQDVVRREMLWVKDGLGTNALPLLIELVKYGKKNCDIVILEGILHSHWYRDLFMQIKIEFDNRIYAYYYDIPFEETLIRHQSKTNWKDFGEVEMKKWWNEKDYIGIISEKIITADLSLDRTVDMIYSHALSS
jgi:hypothetical protein